MHAVSQAAGRSLWAAVLVVLSAAAGLAALRPSVTRADDRPFNVVFILVDDLGWSDVGCCGSDFYETPEIDRFARLGSRFTQAYSASPVCSPTRASIMTGKHPARLDMTIWHEGAVSGGPTNRKLRDATSNPNLPHHEVTLAELFRAAGYFTAHIGKWHLGTAAYYPETQGYQLNVGGTFWGAPATFFYPFSGPWSRDNPEFRYVPGLAPGREGDYLPDRLTDKALQVIESAKDAPFFLSLWYYTVHSPIEAPAELIARFRQKNPGKHHRDPTYAAMVERMDANVGRVLLKLEELRLMDRTIVVFTSDNGGVDFDVRSIVPTSNRPLRSGKGTLYEGGVRVPMLIHWPGVTRPAECAAIVSSQDYLPTFVDYLRTWLPTSMLPSEPIDGISLMPILSNPDGELQRDALFWHFPHYYPRMTPASAMRKDDWKLIHYYETDGYELYNLRDDPGESQNLADAQPALVNSLARELNKWRREVGANSPLVP